MLLMLGTGGVPLKPQTHTNKAMHDPTKSPKMKLLWHDLLQRRYDQQTLHAA